MEERGDYIKTSAGSNPVLTTKLLTTIWHTKQS